ncbi:hypothetical protein [Pedobacter sp. CFBP9032]|uniref:hypothetical protein n=1 Tax=Pedobacter sp. CFBP9032 TaxID=3096539 RepID=UPI002A6A904F|nr:hypothetical protein [Pedobacter sp. CFBP9032]MDY0904603.1 hypothetical protein [Pedobacter sp. CFBP9032]
MRYNLIIASFFLFTTSVQSQIKPVRTGLHSFTIQWITFNKSNPGKVYIKEISEDEYSIEGEQRDSKSKEYVTIKGTFLNQGSILKFNGKIVSKINSINGGQPCELNGLSIFKASGKRQYWRLQQMLNCDGETTDYIDIFF